MFGSPVLLSQMAAVAAFFFGASFGCAFFELAGHFHDSGITICLADSSFSRSAS
ncbi:MAG: hypothetical protein NTW52_16375 [Planctomycetota bacterium]|nr:hypothetical protein [Planctomycetota bacterium]